MARLVDLGSPRHTPDPPHIEDYVFVPSHAKIDRPAAMHEFWGLLEEVQCERLCDIFGEAMQETGLGRWGTALKQGCQSLGVLRPAAMPELYRTTDRFGSPRIRMRFTDGRIHVDAGVTDLRLYGNDHATPDAARVCAAMQWINDSRNVLLSVGLTRKFRSSDRHEYRHWLQVNNIHVQENPTWALG
jgi:hypothetical protein